MPIITDYKAHHFFPKALPMTVQVKRPLAALFDQSPEYRNDVINNVGLYVFPGDHFPQRECDIFIEDITTGFLVKKRHFPYHYDFANKTLVFDNLVQFTLKIHWLDFSKLKPYYFKHWTEIPLQVSSSVKKNELIQGFSSIVYPADPDFTPDNIIDQPGTFQGGFRCELEIDTLPMRGMICFNNEMTGLMYRCSIQDELPFDTFQFRLFSYLGQESQPYCVKIQRL